MANAEPVAACSSTRPIPVPQWDSQAFDTQLDYVRNAGDYSAVSEQNGYAPLSVEYEALHDAAQQGALAAVRNGMRCPDAAARFNIASNPEDVETLMLFAATQLGRTRVQNGEPLSRVLDNLGIRPDSLAGQILKNAL